MAQVSWRVLVGSPTGSCPRPEPDPCQAALPSGGPTELPLHRPPEPSLPTGDPPRGPATCSLAGGTFAFQVSDVLNPHLAHWLDTQCCPLPAVGPSGPRLLCPLPAGEEMLL